MRPLFEFSGACAGCGETPYVKLLTQLFGDRLLIANATGCSSIYGGNLPTTPYTKRADGRGPAWSNSLFEDNAEFALGMRLAVDKFHAHALELLEPAGRRRSLRGPATELCWPPSAAPTVDAQPAIEEQRARVAQLKKQLAAGDARGAAGCSRWPTTWWRSRSGSSAATAGPTTSATAAWTTCWPRARTSTCWCSTPRSTPTPAARCPSRRPLAAVAKFAAGGKRTPKKDLGMIIATYGNIYVAQVAMGANPPQTVRAFAEAEAYDGRR